MVRSQNAVQRRLTAIMAADVVSYSRLMREDEEGTYSRLKTLRKDLIEPAIREDGGRVVKLMGDGALVEFPSAVDAVRCAVEIQRAVNLDQRTLPANQRLQFRIGVNLGDVVIDGEDIYGDGVNIAARLETLADPGGISLSAKVFDEVRHRLDMDIAFTDLGEQDLKNIGEPIRAYRVELEPGLAAKVITTAIRKSTWQRWTMAAIAVVAIVLTGAIAWQALWQPQLKTSSPVRKALQLPHKPSIAVFAFENMSGDAAQEYFGDGIAEDIITDLSRLSGLFVIARNSSFFYKGKSKRVDQIARELGVRYVLEGSVRKLGNTVRVTAQLIDGKTGRHIWAERYDRPVSNVFEIQDDITRRIVDALATKLVAGRDKRFDQRTRNIGAYDFYLRAWAHLRKATPDDTAKAVTLFKAAVDLDPDFSRAHAALAQAYLLARQFQWHRSLGLASQFDTETLANRQIDLAMQKPSALAFGVRAEIYYREGRYRNALDDLTQAQALDPNNASYFAKRGLIFIKLGRADEAIQPLQMAIRLDPNQQGYSAALGIAEFARGRFAEAAQLIKEAFQRNPQDSLHLDHLVAAYAYLGQYDEARASLRDLNALRTKAGIEPYTLFVSAKSVFYSNDCDFFRLREGLRKAGVPAGPQPEPPITGANCQTTGKP